MTNLVIDPIENEFSPSRLVMARMRRAMTQSELGKLIEVGKTAISRYENGERIPDMATSLSLSVHLNFPTRFFYGSAIDIDSTDGVSFRARRSEVKAITRDRTLASLAMACEIAEKQVSKIFRQPACDVPNIADLPPAMAAATLRATWGLGSLPIPNMVHLMEAKGVRVYWFDEDDPSVDAVSKIHASVPFALLSQRARGGERMRFDLAHELGHLVMHRGQSELSIKAIEDQANQFAAAFLMPDAQFKTECPAFPTLITLLNLKPRWGVSLQALVHRCYDLGIFSESQYRSAYIKINAQGWRKQEPGQLPAEESKTWEHILRHFERTGTTIQQFAYKLDVFESEIYNLVPVAKKYGNAGRNTFARRQEDHYLNINELGYSFDEESLERG